MAEKDPSATGGDRPATTEPRADPVDDQVTTSHLLHTAGGDLAYTASTGRVVLREDVHTDGVFDGRKVKAELFLVAYTLDGADPATRPVTFAFNGGPGSSSVWLHLGLLGPRRVVMGDAGALTGPPWALTDNAESLLAHSDLVFIDPVSTGYSRVSTGGKSDEFHGFARDVDAVAEVIRLWTSRNARWVSPKYLAGESYGTTRAAAVTAHLQEKFSFFLNGVILISAVLDFATLDFYEGNDLPYALYLPTYASVAAFHGRTGDRPVAAVRAEAEQLATRELPHALAQGSRLPVAERAELVSRVAAVTGLSEDYIERVNLRIEHTRFFRELLRAQGLVAGRLDGRFTGWEADGGGEAMSYDPSMSAIQGPYAAAMNHYARTELGYSSDLPYEVISERVHPWSYADFEARPVTVVPRLGEAMRHNPHLRLYVAFGYTDGATPYAAAEHTLAQLQIPEQLQANITRQYFEAGHMMYVHEPSRVALSRALADFVTDGSASPIPAAEVRPSNR